MTSHRKILPLVALGVLLAVLTAATADDVSHKKVIVKVPKKIKHVHHHHVKKVHIYKHKPKPIHSIHVIEEDEPIGKEWRNALKGRRSKHAYHKGSFGGGWKHYEDDEEYGYAGDEEDEGDEEGFHKSGSHHEPTLWKGQKTNGKLGDLRSASTSKGRTSERPIWKEERPKRQKNSGSNKRPTSGHRYRTNKPKISNHSSKPKKQRSNRPVEKGYSDYFEYYDDGYRHPVWPERKEHISWHVRENEWAIPPQVTESPQYVIEDYKNEHRGEINMAKPEIQIVEAPQLGPNLVSQTHKQWGHGGGREPQPWITQSPPIWGKDSQESYSWLNEVPQKTHLWEKEVHQEDQVWPRPADQAPKKTTDARKKKKKKPDVPRTRKPAVQEQKEVPAPEGYRTEVEQNGAGYSSQVGHTEEGDAASFQAVRFGDRIKNR